MEPVPAVVETVSVEVAATSEESQLFSKFLNHVSCGFNLKYCPGNCMFLVCRCAEEMVKVTVPDGEVILWPKRVVLVGYPIYKHFEAKKKPDGKKQLVNAFLLLSSRYCGLLS